MALITNNISGSSSDSWRIGITGSVRIANPGAGVFPAMPGNDTVFFVSGSRGGKGTSGVSVFGGDAVVSGSLTIGTGSIYIDSNEIRFYGDNPNAGNPPTITSSSSGLTFYDATYTSGITLSSLASSSPAGSSGQFQYNNGGNLAGSTELSYDSTLGAIKSGKLIVTSSAADALVSSGTLVIKDGSGNTVVSLSNAGVISGSSNLQAGGNLTVAGTSDLIGVVSASGDLAVNGGDITTTSSTFNLLNETATTVNFAGGASTALNIGPPGGTTTIAGDLAVNGGDITTNQATATLFNATATNVTLAGAATTLTLGTTSGNTTVRNSLIVKGDLYISGTTTTIDSTVMEIQDPVIGLGFASGSVAGTLGDRGFIGGLTGENSIAIFWDESDDKFAIARTNTTPGAAAVGANIAVVDYQAFRAGKVHLGGGTNAFITSSDGSKLKAQAATDLFLDAATGAGANGDVIFQTGGTTYLQISGSGTNTIDIKPAAGVLNANLLNATSTTVNAFGAATSLTMGATAATTTTIRGGTLVGNTAVQNVFNGTATTVNFAGAGTDINIGSSGAGTLYLKNSATNISGSLVVAGATNINGAITLGDASGDNITFTGRINSNVLPSTDVSVDLGSPSLRWRNMYTGDLHLRNERGDYTIIEEEDFLSIRFNKTGKRYKFLLEPVPELDEK